MNKIYAGTTTNGFEVFWDPNDPHMQAHPEITASLLKEVLAKVTYKPPFFMEEVEMGHIIGKTACVIVSPNDDVRWEARPGREIKSPVVYGKNPEDTSVVTVGICTDRDDGVVTLFTAFAGEKAPKEPNDPHLRPEEKEESERFWSTHAMCACHQ